MTLQNEIENNLKEFFPVDDSSKPLFVPTSKEQFDTLKDLIGDKAKTFIDFYKISQPNQISISKSNSTLLDIDSIIEENTELSPGVPLSKIGIFVFAVTTGGNAICIDTNDTKDGDPVVLIIDHSFIYFDSYDSEEGIEIANLPSYFDEDNYDDEDFEFNYENVRKFVYKIEDSFIEFIRKYSQNLYDDFEKNL